MLMFGTATATGIGQVDDIRRGPVSTLVFYVSPIRIRGK